MRTEGQEDGMGGGSSRPWCSRRVYVGIALCIPRLNPL